MEFPCVETEDWKSSMKVRIKLRDRIEELLSTDTGRHWAHDVLVFTRHWIHYGTIGFVILTILTAGALGLIGRMP